MQSSNLHFGLLLYPRRFQSKTQEINGLPLYFDAPYLWNGGALLTPMKNLLDTALVTAFAILLIPHQKTKEETQYEESTWQIA